MEKLAGKIRSEEPEEEKPEIREKKPEPKIERKVPEKKQKAKEEKKLPEIPEIREEKPPEAPEIKEERKIEEVKEEPKKPGLRERLTGKILEKELSAKDIDEFFGEVELDLMEANVALEVVDFLKGRMKEIVSGSRIKRGEAEKFVRETFERLLVEVMDHGKIDVLKMKKPACIVFLGFNGSGKTTSIAKLAEYLKKKGKTVILAAGDTWRSAAIEQLEHHGERLGLKVIKHKYGSDSAAVVFDAVAHAKSKGIDFVLADTAGRSHADRNLMDELKKVVRVNQPDLKVLVVDSLTGNDVVEQAKKFDEAVGVDAFVFTKIDVNKKGGSLLSACNSIKKPVLFIGVGQDYSDIEMFDPGKIAKDMMG